MRATLRGLALGLGVGVACLSVACAQLIGADFDVTAAADAGDAGAVEVVASLLELPLGIAARDGFVYWSVSQAGTIMRAPSAGGPAVVLASGQTAPDQVAVDGTHVYWTTYAGSGGVFRVPRAGGSVEELASQQGTPIGIVVDETSVYWTAADFVKKRSLVAGASTEVTSFANLGGHPRPTLLAQDGAHLYFTDTSPDGGVYRLDKDDAGSEVTLVSHQDTSNGLVVDTAQNLVFFTTWNDHGTVSRVPSDTVSATAATLAYEQHQPASIAADSAYLYWTNFGDGTVCRLQKAGGTVDVIASGQASPNGIAVDETYVYWTNLAMDGAVMKWRKTP